MDPEKNAYEIYQSLVARQKRAERTGERIKYGVSDDELEKARQAALEYLDNYIASLMEEQTALRFDLDELVETEKTYKDSTSRRAIDNRVKQDKLRVDIKNLGDRLRRWRGNEKAVLDAAPPAASVVVVVNNSNNNNSVDEGEMEVEAARQLERFVWEQEDDDDDDENTLNIVVLPEQRTTPFWQRLLDESQRERLLGDDLVIQVMQEYLDPYWLNAGNPSQEGLEFQYLSGKKHQAKLVKGDPGRQVLFTLNIYHTYDEAVRIELASMACAMITDTHTKLDGIVIPILARHLRTFTVTEIGRGTAMDRLFGFDALPEEERNYPVSVTLTEYPGPALMLHVWHLSTKDKLAVLYQVLYSLYQGKYAHGIEYNALDRTTVCLEMPTTQKAPKFSFISDKYKTSLVSAYRTRLLYDSRMTLDKKKEQSNMLQDQDYRDFAKLIRQLAFETKEREALLSLFNDADASAGILFDQVSDKIVQSYLVLK